MKTLYLLRHAKAERDASSGEDFDRALDERGRRDCTAMARFLAARGWTPDIVVASPSRRTAETVQLVASAWPATPRIEAEQSLYLAEPERIAGTVQALPDAARSAMIVGHNPGLESFAGALAERGSKPARKALNQGFPTCALAVVELDVERWTDLAVKSAQLTGLYVAKDLADRH